MQDQQPQVRVPSETTVVLPLAETERTMAVRNVEWKRVRVRVQRLADPLERVASGWSLFFLGAAVTGALSVLGLYTGSVKPKSWAVAIYGTGTFFCVLLALTWMWFERRSGKGRRDEVTEICSEMDDIEARFGNPPGAE